MVIISFKIVFLYLNLVAVHYQKVTWQKHKKNLTETNPEVNLQLYFNVIIYENPTFPSWSGKIGLDMLRERWKGGDGLLIVRCASLTLVPIGSRGCLLRATVPRQGFPQCIQQTELSSHPGMDPCAHS